MQGKSIASCQNLVNKHNKTTELNKITLEPISKINYFFMSSGCRQAGTNIYR